MVMGSIPEKVNLAIIGGGVGGYVAAIRAAELGLSVIIIEKEKMGGHCLNYACIPSKTLLHIADIYYKSKNSQNFGIEAEPKINMQKIFGWRVDVSEKLEKGVEFLCNSNGIEIIKGEATFISSQKLQITNGTEIDFDTAIIATGSVPVEMEGFEFNDYIIDYKKALMLSELPKTLTIIGAGYVAVELATLYAKLGVLVSIIARSTLLSHFDPEAISVIEKNLLKLNVKIYKNSVPVSHTKTSIKLKSGEDIPHDLVVVAVGLKPYTSNLGLENTKVNLDQKGFITVGSSLNTTDEKILAIGDVVGEPMLAHKSMRQGVIAAEVASGKNAGFDNVVIPAVIFSDPEIGIAGDITEKNGITVKKFPLTALGRAIAMNKTDGFIKIAFDTNKIVKGIEVVSDDANAIIAEAALAIEMGATLEDIAYTIHPHPTYSEQVQEVAEAGLGMPIHFFYGKNNENGKQI
ncbi:MAG: dihydrolipoyl dehydrogenase [Candidatus Micrarchaeaceae archaeon]